MSDNSPMRPRSERLISAIGGRRIVLTLGGTYVAVAAIFPFVSGLEEGSLELVAVLWILVGGPGLAVLYGGYRLPRTEIRPEFYATVCKWTLRGIAVTLGVVGLIVFASGNSNIVANTLLLTALGSVAGFAAGIHDARAKTRELELRETIDRLRTSNERLDQFAYAASHDLQEPLRMVSSYLQLLEDRHGDDIDEEGREFLDFAVGGADRMRAMVDSLLTYSRVTTRGNSPTPTNADAVLEEVREDLQPEIEATNATITAEALPTVTADGEQLGEVFEQLLSNALAYSGDGDPQVHVSAKRNGRTVQFAVADEGIGVDPEFHDRIFEVFERVHTRADGPVGGTGGIGLALCERIVERHDGEIRVESAPGEGSTFSFTLPARDEHSE